MSQKDLKQRKISLQELREDTGISQQQLALWTGLSLSAIKKLEAGKRDLNKISLETAFKLAVVLKVPIEFLVDPSDVKLNKKYVEYYKEVMDQVYDCYILKNKEDKYYIPYSENSDPYEILEKIEEDKCADLKRVEI